MEPYATVDDVQILFRELDCREQSRAEKMLPLVSDLIRTKAASVGFDIDARVAADTAYASTVKLVTVDVVSRVLRQSTTGEPMSQESQAAMGYSWSGTFAIPGGGVAASLLPSDLKRLGIVKAQKAGTIRLDGGPCEVGT